MGARAVSHGNNQRAVYIRRTPAPKPRSNHRIRRCNCAKDISTKEKATFKGTRFSQEDVDQKRAQSARPPPLKRPGQAVGMILRVTISRRAFFLPHCA